MSESDLRHCSELFQPHDPYKIGVKPIRRWCPFSRNTRWGEVSTNWYGIAHVCEKSGKTVTWNKKCDFGLTINDLKADEIRNPSKEEP